MKRIVLLCSLLAVPALADGNDSATNTAATPVYVVASQAATTCADTTAAAGAQAVATVQAVAGQYFYVTSIELSLHAIAAPVATLMPFTTTNLPGAKTFRMAVQAAVGSQVQAVSYPVPLKATAVGALVAITGPTGLANVSQNISVCGFYAK